MERVLDRLVAAVSPTRGMQREIDRRRLHLFRHQSAESNPGRRNVSPAEIAGETAAGNRERLQMQWNALDLVDNSGLAEGLRKKFVQYIAGMVRYQARTGDKRINSLYEDYIKVCTGKSLDVSQRNSLRSMARLAVSSIMVKGDIGFNVVRNGNYLQLQGIEADRIGNPHEYKASRNYIAGVHLNESQVHLGYDIFTRDRNSMQYRFTEYIPARDRVGFPRFLFAHNRFNFDEVRGRTIFKTAIDNVKFLHEMRRYELMAMMWAGSRAGVFYTNTGELPGGLPYDANVATTNNDRFGNTTRQTLIQPNAITAMGIGERVEMMASDRPSPNVIGMYHDTIREIACGLGISYGLAFELTGTGPSVRTQNAQDARTFALWQDMIDEDFLGQALILLLGNGIDNGEIPYHEEWHKYGIIFPPSITIDSGRESYANIALREAGLLSGSTITGEAAEDMEEVQEAITRETENYIELAQAMVERLAKKGIKLSLTDVLTMMLPKGGGGKPINEGASIAVKNTAEALDTAKNGTNGATSEGVELEDAA